MQNSLSNQSNSRFVPIIYSPFIWGRKAGGEQVGLVILLKNLFDPTPFLHAAE